MQVSIIIPTLNRYESLRILLNCLSELPTQPLEYIILDQTKHVMGRDDVPDFSNERSRIKHLYLDFVGPCISRNYGASIAQGEILWFIDDDMYPSFDVDPIKHIVAHYSLEHNSVLVATIDPIPVTSFKLKGRFDILAHLTRNWRIEDKPHHFSLGIAAGNFTIPKVIFEEIGGFDERFDPNGAMEDRELGLRCFLHGIFVFQSDELYMEHRALSTGGRRESLPNSQLDRNRYIFWANYMSEDNYYLQGIAYWLSQRKNSFLRKVLKAVAMRFLNIPKYETVKDVNILTDFAELE